MSKIDMSKIEIPGPKQLPGESGAAVFLNSKRLRRSYAHYTGSEVGSLIPNLKRYMRRMAEEAGWKPDEITWTTSRTWAEPGMLLNRSGKSILVPQTETQIPIKLVGVALAVAGLLGLRKKNIQQENKKAEEKVLSANCAV